ASRFGIPVVEDAAESIGSSVGGRMTGTFGLLGILSFNGNKTITTGGGGAILTNDSALAKRAKHLTTTAKVPHRWEFFHDEVGYNFRLPNLNAAMGCAQLERLPDILKRKRLLADRFMSSFSGASGLAFVSEPAGTNSNYWLNTVKLDIPDTAIRNKLLEAAYARGYHCRPVWRLLHKLPMYQNCPRAELTTAEALEASLISIPSSARLVEI
ncbi:MAG: aminotransferase DegT, partial [Proteobacteria bacterium]|nr:aminotransferase DegT [Pseudomonadota bacterium]